jgi:hypothetical protein
VYTSFFCPFFPPGLLYIHLISSALKVQVQRGHNNDEVFVIPYLRAIITYNFPKNNQIGVYFDYYYKFATFGLGVRCIADIKGFPLFVRKELN